jgi:hypothetical protein
MQCPSCGFENIPGSERCCKCSALLAPDPVRVRIYPPRARDRTWGQRLRYALTGARDWAYADGSLRAHQPQTPHHTTQRGLQAAACILRSIIPGLAPPRTPGEVRRGRLMLLGSVAALALAVLSYRSWLSNVLLWSVVGLSAMSVAATVHELRTQGQVGDRNELVRIGIVLVVLAIYLAMYMAIQLSLTPLLIAVNLEAQPWGEGPASGDTLLIWRRGPLERGALVWATVRQEYGDVPNIGPVVGLPGDRIDVTDRVYLNGIRTRFALPTPVEAQGVPAAGGVILTADEYWIMPAYYANEGNAQALLQAGRVVSADIHGRAVAVLGPAAHRRRLGAQAVLYGGDGHDAR